MHGGWRTAAAARRLADGTVLRTACTEDSVGKIGLSLLTPVLWILLLIVVAMVIIKPF